MNKKQQVTEVAGDENTGVSVFPVAELLEKMSERIRLAITEGGGDTAVSKTSGVKISTIQSYKSGKAMPNAKALGDIAKATGFRLDWLVHAEGRKYERPDVPDRFEDLVLVPRLAGDVSAGAGGLVDPERVVDHLAFSQAFVRQVLAADPAHLVLIGAVGDSMEPAIRAGDLLLVDTATQRFVDDAIYIVVVHGELVVKRIQRHLDGAVTVRSDNPAYDDETADKDHAAELSVAGRVRWIGRLI